MRILKANALINKSKMTEEEWRNERLAGIGGSDAATIVGLNPYQSLFSLYAIKTGLIEDVEDNERMRQGRDFEDYVAKRFEERMTEKSTPKKTKNCNYILQHPTHQFMLANVDRLIIGENAGLECKVTSMLNLKKFKNGEYPEQYYPQCVHYMAVTGAERWYLAVLILGHGLETFTIDRDEEEVELLIKAESNFWENNILKQIPPPVDGSEATKNTLCEIYPYAKETGDIVLTCDNAVLNLVEIKAQIKLLETEKDKCENIIKSELASYERGTSGEYRIAWTNSQRSSFNSDRFKEANPAIDLSPYYDITASRRFTLSKLKSK